MAKQRNFVDVGIIREMLYDDDGYVKEFSKASIQSFSEFQTNFKESVLARDMEELRRAGHKIKPVAMMLKLQPVIDMYEKSKDYIKENRSTEELADLTNEMDVYCDQILSEFNELI
ncbi:hypothetical protein [Rhodohalobacter halophilus]|uniref:hypothetical protein n=1 Tax=Rhodohalobacter halophilus TaxID=1812810 RepID=UPI0009FE59DA|nr:hypothetical protein [Rhodohalobacter halophilus]